MLDTEIKLKTPQEYLDMILKRWHLSATLFVIIFSLTLIKAVKQKYTYEAVTKIIISEGFGAKTLGNSFDIYRNHLYEEQEFATLPFIIKSNPIANSIANRLSWVDAEKNPNQFTALLGQIKGSLSIERIGDSRLFEIKATHSEAGKAQLLANTAADVFIENNLEKKLNYFRKSISWLTDQLIDLEYKLEESQKDLVKYIEKERVTSFGEQSVLPDSVSSAQDILGSKSLIQRLKSIKVEQELELQQLLQRYTEKHPKVARLKDELKITRAKIFSEEKSLKESDQSRESEAIRNKQKEIKYSILKRKVDINKELYNSLIQKMKEIDISSAINENNIYIMEQANIPPAPIRPKKMRLVLLGFFIASFVAIGLPIVIDFLDPTLRTSDEVEAFLTLPVLSSIPKFSESANGAMTPSGYHLISPENSTEAEAFRILRTNIRFSFPAAKGNCLLVTSSGPHEGKSTIASNLAITFAAAGKKVCLIDADLRIPKVHKIFSLSNSNGLTNYLVGVENTVDTIMQKTPYENLTIITSGMPSPKPSELLETKEMHDTVDKLLKRFDQVIIDSPPAGNIIDASILASIVDGVIFVLEAGKINKGHVKSAKDQLDRVKANICGAVLNKVEVLKKHSYLYYYYHRGKPKKDGNGKDPAPPPPDNQLPAV